jgi:hypothetical protein
VSPVEIEHVPDSYISSICLLHCGFRLAYSTLKMEATYSPEKSVKFEQIAQRYIPEDMTLDVYSKGFW